MAYDDGCPPCPPPRRVKRLWGPKTYEQEPARHAGLLINSQEPFNAEPPAAALVNSYLTHEDIFYKRNHGPIPILLDPLTYKLVVTGHVENSLSLSLEYIQKLPKHTVVATLQCAGNRRTEMSMTRKVKGVGWGSAALGTAAWTGARLSDVLKLAKIENCSTVSSSGGRHVEFVSCDVCKDLLPVDQANIPSIYVPSGKLEVISLAVEEEDGGPYKSSIPLLQATSPAADVILAYEMNGKTLNRDHGYPLRVIVPGVIGARSVKWLETIIVSKVECQGFFQQRDYKMFPPWVDWNTIKWETRRPLMDFPVQSVICEPKDGIAVESGIMVNFHGYALAGGGRGIERVELSVDGGKKWLEAHRLPKEKNCAQGLDDNPDRPQWAWALWELKYIKVYPPTTVIVKAVDTSANVQPKDVDEIWNLRGVLNNSWHRIKINAPEPRSNLCGDCGGPDWAKNSANNSKRRCPGPPEHQHEPLPRPDVLDDF